MLSASLLVRQPLLAQFTGGVGSRTSPLLQMSFMDVAANGAGAVLVAYAAGAAAGPAVSAFASLATGVRLGRKFRMLTTSIAFAGSFTLLAGFLAANAITLGWTALSLAPPLLAPPLLITMVAIVAGLVPMTALITGTFFSPAIPFQDQEDADEYQAMQASYQSDAWQPPKLWPGRSKAGSDRDEYEDE